MLHSKRSKKLLPPRFLPTHFSCWGETTQGKVRAVPPRKLARVGGVFRVPLCLHVVFRLCRALRSRGVIRVEKLHLVRGTCLGVVIRVQNCARTFVVARLGGVPRVESTARVALRALELRFEWRTRDVFVSHAPKSRFECRTRHVLCLTFWRSDSRAARTVWSFARFCGVTRVESAAVLCLTLWSGDSSANICPMAGCCPVLTSLQWRRPAAVTVASRAPPRQGILRVCALLGLPCELE